MTFGWPQVIYIALTFMGLGVSIIKHGQPRLPHSMWTHLLAIAIAYPLLWWGGFFG